MKYFLEKGMVMKRLIIGCSEGNFRTLAHEIGHACGLEDIYDEKQNLSLSDTMNPSISSLQGDWSGGSGRGYYKNAHKELVKKLLMFGFTSDTKMDISFDRIYGVRGYLDTPIFDYMKTGLTNMNRQPEHY